MNSSVKFSICIYTDANFLALNIFENLLSKNCFINIITNDTDNWSFKTSNVFSKDRFAILNQKTFIPKYKFDYAIFCGGFKQKDKAYDAFRKFVFSSGVSANKTLILFPYEIYSYPGLEKIGVNPSRAIIFLGDLMGPRIDLDSDLFLPTLLREIIFNKKITLGVGETIYPLFAAEVSKNLVHSLFSFGPYGKKTLLLGPQTSGDVFWRLNKEAIGEIKLEYQPKTVIRKLPKGLDQQVLEGGLGFMLKETYEWLSNHSEDLEKGKTTKVKISGTNKVGNSVRSNNVKKFRSPPKVKYVFWILGLILILPFATLFVGISLLFSGYKLYTWSRTGSSQNLITISKVFSDISANESHILRQIPGLGLIYKEVDYSANMISYLDASALHLMPFIRNSTTLFSNIFGSNIYDPSSSSLKLRSDIELIYPDVFAISLLTKKEASDGVILAQKILAKIDFEKYLNLLLQARDLSGNLPDILGTGKSKTYLVVFQNNMELRPTGGFIGSFGLLTFDGGRNTGMDISDVYSADGQLNGHVEPPEPIKKYLNEANWWLRDSNWDPDFPTSGKRAEWFLDKELGKKVDGVISIDLSPIKDLLGAIGPVFLSDYNMDITRANLYEKTQNEVQNNSFPGTHQKASFLTALSRNLLSKISDLKSAQKLAVLKSFYTNLNGRHIQIYLHNDQSQKAFSKLGWDGEVAIPYCGSNCLSDFTGLVEANVGVNKANFFIKRSVNLNIGIKNDEILHNLNINYKNNANQALGYPGKYINYLRIIMPVNAINISIKSRSGASVQDLPLETSDLRGHKEVGTLVEIVPRESKNIEVYWSVPKDVTANQNSYGIYLRKQGGTEDDATSIAVKGFGTKITPDPRFSLTKDGTYLYNTSLTQDIFSRFTW